MCDEGGANHTALNAVFGPTVKNRTITCLFHFEQCKNRYANALAKAAKQEKGEEANRNSPSGLTVTRQVSNRNSPSGLTVTRQVV